MKMKLQIKEGLTGVRCKFYIESLHTLKRYYKLKIKEPLPYVVTGLDGLFFANGLNCFIFLKKYVNTPRCNNALQHEINHLVKHIIRECGLGQNEEVHSYMVGEVTQLFKHRYNQLCKHKEKLQQQKLKKTKRK